MNIPDGYRELNKGEVMEVGDMIFWDSGTMGNYHIEPDSSANGKRFGVDPGQTGIHGGYAWRALRPIASAPQGWISFKDRMPTQADGDNVLVCFIYESSQSVAQQSLRQVSEYRIPSSYAKYWMPMPPLPAKPVIKVGEHKVDFRKDGSIKVGCTEVSSELFEQIAARRKGEMQ